MVAIFKKWYLHLTSTPALLSAIASQALCYNENIKIDNKSIYSAEFSKKDLNCVGHLFNERQRSKMWDELKQEYRFLENRRFLFMQLLHAIPKSWIEDLSNVKQDIHNLVIQDHHITRKHHMYFLNRLSSKDIYNFLIAQKEEQTASRLYYQKKFSNSNLDWKKIYLLVCIVTKDSTLRAFQFKLLNNVLYLNKMLFKFGKSGSPLCSFCNVKDETPYHLFYECSHTISLWNQLRHFLSNSLNIPLLTPQSAIFGFINQKENFLIINHLLFIFKFYIYNSRSSSKLNIEYLKTIIYKTRNIELEVSKTETINNQKYNNKRQSIPITYSK